MSYYAEHPRKREAARWHGQRHPKGYRGFCNHYDIYPLPEMAIPPWADPHWERRYPKLSIEDLDSLLRKTERKLKKLLKGDLTGDKRKMTPEVRREFRVLASRRMKALDDLSLLDPFWRGQTRGHIGGHGKRLWREEREAYDAYKKAELT